VQCCSVLHLRAADLRWGLMSSVSTPPSKGRTFFTRLSSTLLLWAVMGYSIWAHNNPLFLGMAAFFGVATSVEYFRLMGAQSFGGLGNLLALGYWVGVYLWPAHGYALDLTVLVLAVQLSFVLVYRQALDGAATLLRVYSTVAGVFYSTVCFGFLLRLADYPGCEHSFPGVYLMLFCIMVTKFSDMGAYAVGSLIGRNKMIPHVSPAKSWEGLGGAFAAGLMAAAGMMAWVPEHLAPLSWASALAIAPVLVLTAVSGDLAESVLKRCVAIKDSGHTLPGIGGVLDLTDSLLFTAPLFYGYLRWLET
jgi:phosphatidate cytidylyltransferase